MKRILFTTVIVLTVALIAYLDGFLFDVSEDDVDSETSGALSVYFLPQPHVAAGTSVPDPASLLESFRGEDSFVLDINSQRRLRELMRLRPADYFLSDIDTDAERREGRRAFSVMAESFLGDLISSSEFKDLYQAARRNLESAKDTLQFSLEESEDGVVFVNSAGADSNRKKYLAFDVRLDASRGIDPQLRLGDVVVVRYDRSKDLGMVEYEIDF